MSWKGHPRERTSRRSSEEMLRVWIWGEQGQGRGEGGPGDAGRVLRGGEEFS